jgi:site-specific DNA-methyltransferase (adenine-specific)
MTVFYQDDLITLIHGDCLDYEEWLDAEVLVTDPPYGMSYQSNRSKSGPSKLIAKDETTEARDLVLDKWGSKPALVFGTWKVERPKDIRSLLVWSKGNDPGMGDLSLPWGNSHEEIYVLGSGFTGKRGTSVLTYNKPPVSTRPDHPTPKPIALMEALISKTQGVIADPFAGSGSTLIAARNLGRKAIGIEIDKTYCEIIVERLGQQTFNFGDL